jgi:hypothetical protein
VYQASRAKWVEDSKILAGPFIPSGDGVCPDLTSIYLPTLDFVLRQKQHFFFL